MIKKFPLIDFSIQMMNSKEVVSSIENREATIGIYEKPIATNFMQEKILLKDELVLAGNPNSTFWILREKDSGIRFFNDIYLKEHHLKPKFIYVNNNEILLKLLENNVGQSVISKLSISSSICWKPVDDYSKYRNIFITKNNGDFSKEITDVYNWIIKNSQVIIANTSC
ncbi:LysR substrate-binding domain-containing protein [Enterococcus sp. DIV1420a]|uniref:LysR substrate-binding domain-containing protein n=1 Tax=Enterococcus sp. DIV1420a TaxID=2774672 RepID=UPI003F2452DF